MNVKIIVSLVIFQLIIIVFLTYSIYNKNNNILGVLSENSIKKENIIYNPNSKLKYFFEPKPNEDQKENPAWLDHTVSYSINTDSLNERFNYPLYKAPYIYRIITLGDSYTFGANVNTRDNWSEKLEDMLNSKLTCREYNKYEVINLGVSGYDIQYEVERYKIRGPKYNPDLIIWAINDNSFFNINEISTPVGIAYLEQLKQNGLYEKYNANGSANYLSFKVRTDWLHTKYDINKTVDYQLEALPNINTYFNKNLILFNFLRFHIDQDRIDNLLKHNSNYLFFDDSKDCDKKLCSKEYTFIPYDHHPNEKGHQLIAQDMFNYLTNNKIIPCN